MPIATPEIYAQMLDRAKEHGFAYPAINVTSSQTLNAALRGFADAESDGIIQVSTGGAADGSTVDAEGCLWNAQVYDGKLVRYTPEGKVDRVIEMPVKKVTSVNFGGPDLDVLYVTSMARPPLPRFPDDDQLRGSLFAIHGLGVKGLPEPRFAG